MNTERKLASASPVLQTASELPRAEQTARPRDASSEAVLKLKLHKQYEDYKKLQTELAALNVNRALGGPTHEHEKMLAVVNKLTEIVNLLPAIDETLMETGATPDSPIRSQFGRELVMYRALLKKSQETHEFSRTASALKLGQIEKAFNQRGAAITALSDDKNFARGSMMQEMATQATDQEGVLASEFKEKEKPAATLEDYAAELTQVEAKIAASRKEIEEYNPGKVKEKPDGTLAAVGVLGFLNRALAREIAAHNALVAEQIRLAEIVVPRKSMRTTIGSLRDEKSIKLEKITSSKTDGQGTFNAQANFAEKPAETNDLIAMAEAAQGKGTLAGTLHEREAQELTQEDYEILLPIVQQKIREYKKRFAQLRGLNEKPTKAEEADYKKLLAQEIDITDKVIDKGGLRGVVKNARQGVGFIPTKIESGENATHKSGETALEYYSKPFEEAKRKQAEREAAEAEEAKVKSTIPKFGIPNTPTNPKAKKFAQLEARHRQRASLKEPTPTRLRTNEELAAVRQLEATGAALQSIANKMDEGRSPTAGYLKEILRREGLMGNSDETRIMQNGKALTFNDIVKASSKGLPGFKQFNKDRAIEFFDALSTESFAKAKKISAEGLQ